MKDITIFTLLVVGFFVLFVVAPITFIKLSKDNSEISFDAFESLENLTNPKAIELTKLLYSDGQITNKEFDQIICEEYKLRKNKIVEGM
jgi:uncharacterized membrane protein